MDIDPQDALAAMREIRSAMVKTCGELRTLLELETIPRGEFDELASKMLAYAEQLQLLWTRYCARRD